MKPGAKIIPLTPAASGDVAGRLAAVIEVLSEEYSKRHNDPWIVAYSGGKDSTLLLHLIFEAVLALPPEERKRRVHIIANDTLVESPPVIAHLHKSMENICAAIKKMALPMTATITEPCMDDTFWVNVIGRGYIPPTRNFRWCTDRMKIHPANQQIRRITAAGGRSVLLVGTRKSESSTRRRRMEKHEKNGGRMNPHNQVERCRMFAPLAELTDDDVWMILMQRPAPWGGSHRNLVTLYRNAGGGECPLVLTKDDAPSCGTTSPRFGCWTCTVVQKDRSLNGLIDSGLEELEPYFEFREWLVKLREKKSSRARYRRDGRTKYRDDGSQVMGPFKLEVRRKILRRLQELEKEVGRELITQWELRFIEDIWRRDTARQSARNELMDRLGVARVA